MLQHQIQQDHCQNVCLFGPELSPGSEPLRPWQQKQQHAVVPPTTIGSHEPQFVCLSGNAQRGARTASVGSFLEMSQLGGSSNLRGIHPPPPPPNAIDSPPSVDQAPSPLLDLRLFLSLHHPLLHPLHSTAGGNALWEISNGGTGTLSASI